jgi:ribosomal protein S18 acetylase RimI-like enzyme
MDDLDNVKIRNGTPFDHEKVISAMPEWWDGRDLSTAALKVFFIHFRDTTYIAEIGNKLVGFLIGFMSQSERKVGYIHFVGVHPQFRRGGAVWILNVPIGALGVLFNLEQLLIDLIM